MYKYLVILMIYGNYVHRVEKREGGLGFRQNTTCMFDSRCAVSALLQTFFHLMLILQIARIS